MKAALDNTKSALPGTHGCKSSQMIKSELFPFTAMGNLTTSLVKMCRMGHLSCTTAPIRKSSRAARSASFRLVRIERLVREAGCRFKDGNRSYRCKVVH